MGRKLTETDRQVVGRLLKMEAGLSQVKAGDGMTFKNLIFDEIIQNWPWARNEQDKAHKRWAKRDGLKKSKR